MKKFLMHRTILKKALLFGIFGTLLLGAAGCSSGSSQVSSTTEAETQSVSTEAPTEAETEAEGPDLTGLKKSPLTGLYIDEEAAEQRPIAVMINNHKKALPQSGIGEADIIYETEAEGGITRMLALFQAASGEKIGPVRSCREYYTTFALDNDAIYIHHGGSPSGYSAISSRGINNLDGMNGGAAFFRDKERQSQAGMYEHSSYVKSSGIYEMVEAKKYRDKLLEGASPMLSFSEQDRVFAGAEAATDVVIPFSSYQTSEFIYDSASMEYERYQNGSPQIDAETGETLRTKNILIQLTDIYVVDDAGRVEMDIIGSGTGKYITNGKAINISWSKKSQKEPTQWFDEEGKPLLLNSGKSWVIVCKPSTALSFARASE